MNTSNYSILFLLMTTIFTSSQSKKKEKYKNMDSTDMSTIPDSKEFYSYEHNSDYESYSRELERKLHKKKRIYYHWDSNDTIIKLDMKYRKKKKWYKRRRNSHSSSSSSEYEHAPPLMDLSGGLRRKFAYVVLPFESKSSIVCSPIAALLPLGKLVFGAERGSQREIISAAGITDSSTVNSIGSHFKNIIEHLKNIQGVHLDIASQVFLPKDKKLKSQYEENVKNTFINNVGLYDPHDTGIAASNINSWVSGVTQGNISDVIHAADLSKPAVLVINAVYFTGEWKYPFQNVRRGLFYYGDDGVVENTVMTATGWFKYGKSKSLGSHIINIPYKEGEAELCIFLPEEKWGLSLLLQQLNIAPDVMNKVEMSMRTMRVIIPKFRIESHVNLELAYRKIGINGIFSETSGLTSMVENNNLTVSTAVQRTIIEVTDDGNKAEVGEEMEGLSARNTFKADHPFLFFVMANKQQILAGVFAG